MPGLRLLAGRGLLLQAGTLLGDLPLVLGSGRLARRGRLPGGLDYPVMERGATLSVGQRQLISFVRALVYEPRVIVLDEATSSVDSETEEMIQEAIDKLMEGRTALVIAHRLSTIQKADRIIVLDRGEIKETGTHDELLRLGGYYAQLYRMQYKDSEQVTMSNEQPIKDKPGK